jgi:ABC-2 type transport system ATP-binding protein
MAGRVLELAGFSVRFPRFSLGPLDLQVDPGERVGLVGANGAGKSTTLRAVAGRWADYEGRARVLGWEARGSAFAVRRSVGLLPDTLMGLGWMTVAEHLDFLAHFYGTWDGAYAAMLVGALDIPLHSKLATLSRGNQLKVSFVSAEAFRPPLLLLDEPTAGIDPVMRRTLLDLVEEGIRSGGDRAMIYSSHILEDLDRVADRVVLLHHGQITGDWPVRDLQRQKGGSTIGEEVYRRLNDA